MHGEISVENNRPPPPLRYSKSISHDAVCENHQLTYTTTHDVIHITAQILSRSTDCEEVIHHRHYLLVMVIAFDVRAP